MGAAGGPEPRLSPGVGEQVGGGVEGGAEVRVGDLVVCASRAWRERAGLPLEAGMFLVPRRRDGLVLFAASGRSGWVPRSTLRAAPPDDPRVTPAPGWLVGLHRAMRLVGATEVELDEDAGGGIEARIGCPGLDGPRWRELERLAGPAADRLRIRPGSMSRLTVVFPARPPGAVDTGRPGS